MRAKALDTGLAATLGHLLAGVVDLPARYDRRITGLALDSRTLRPGEVFLAIPGSAADGREFVAAALERRAGAVLEQADAPAFTVRHGVPVIGVPGLAERVGLLAARFYGEPSSAMWVAGVTGTNGKTTVSHLIAQVLGAPGWGLIADTPVGVVGTLGYGLHGRLVEGRHTTPDAVTLQRLLAEFRRQGARHTVMEVSSHALAQGRAGGVAFDVAIFTNLSRDHLDYHGTLGAYAEAKRRLFRFPGLGAAVVNLDDPVGASILAQLPPTVVGLGYTLRDDPRARLRALALEMGPWGIRMDLESPAGAGRLESPLLGRFNASNLLAALGALLTLPLPLPALLDALGRAAPVRGRMERFGGEDGTPLVVVDYAHTPDALEQVLRTLREHCAGALTCVFGCGGERDRGKRPEMGRVAEERADRVIVTDDNPRREDGDRIVAEILAGFAAPERVAVERDRARAIAIALAGARPEDVVLVAGKGHEDYQEVAGERRPFSDQAVVRRLLARGGHR